MGNKEKRYYAETVHLFLGLQRTKDGEKSRCIRKVIKDNEQETLSVFRAQLKCLGGKWRIHKTVNRRNCEEARKILIKKLIDRPELASNIDSAWRTALLQRKARAETFFLLDIDTKCRLTHTEILLYLRDKDIVVQEFRQTPNGFHIVTKPFDVRELKDKYEDVFSFQRDGYIFIEALG